MKVFTVYIGFYVFLKRNSRLWLSGYSFQTNTGHLKENLKINDWNFVEKNTGPRTKLSNLHRMVLKNTGLFIENPRRW